MTIRTITPPIETQYGADTEAQFGEVQKYLVEVYYVENETTHAVEQKLKITVIMDCWEGGASASDGGTPLRFDTFVWEGAVDDPGFPMTKALWDQLRTEQVYPGVQASTVYPPDDPGAYGRGVVNTD